jgi:hypothetical protein
MRAMCASPTLRVMPKRDLRPGQRVTVNGDYWTHECNDTCMSSCLFDNCDEPRPSAPETDIELSIQKASDPSGARVLVAQGIDAGEDLTFEVSFAVPDLAPGRYELVGGDQNGIVQSITRLRVSDP